MYDKILGLFWYGTAALKYRNLNQLEQKVCKRILVEDLNQIVELATEIICGTLSMNGRLMVFIDNTNASN